MSSNQIANRFTREITPIERFFSRSPFSIVTMVVRIRGQVTETLLTKAVAQVQARHALLQSRIVEDENRTPHFTTENAAPIPIQVLPGKTGNDWIEIVEKENRIPFEFEKCPAIRFTLVQSPEVSDLIISCHHLICDGMSLAYLAQDLMYALGDPDRAMENLPELAPISLENLPEGISQSGIVKFFINRINKKWQEVKVDFDQEDYETITEAYWENFNHKLLVIELSEDETSALVNRCKAENVSVNSALSAAFAGAPVLVQGEQAFHARVIVATNLRERLNPPVGEGMGFYAGGVDLKFKYNPRTGFWENARNFQRFAQSRYTNKNMFGEALTWSFLDPTLSEAMNFKKIGGLVSSEKPRHEKLYGFSQQEDVVHSILKRENLDTFDKIIVGTAITNLTRMDFPRKFGELELDRLIMKPGGAFPLSNINLLVGVVTCSGKLSLTMEYSDQNLTPAMAEQIKDQAMTFLSA